MFTATSKLINSTSKFITNLLFPRFCVGCGEEGAWLCSKCAGDIVPVVSQVCPKCAKLSANGEYHLECKKGIALQGIISGAYFEEGPVREMIHNLKYNGVVELVELLGNLMANSFDLSRLGDLSSLCLTFTPLHWQRRAQRGYNQAELLAKEISRRLDIPVVNALIKTKGTKRQVELTGEARRKNLKGLFKVKKNVILNEVKDLSHFGILRFAQNDSLKGKTIILVDDVYTTGSTLNECARVLKKAGAKEVWGFVIARG